jgi:CheY-like chemotaxis protein
LSVVNDILDFSKVEAGQLALESVPFDVPDVLEQALEVVAIRAHTKGLEVSGRIARGAPARVVGDPVRLRQILLNLLVNAVKFTDRGEVSVMVTTADPGDGKPGALHFAVSDTGIGIPADRILAIFDSFAQVDTSTTRRFGGTGLGLAIAKRFVELMGGRIWAESTPGWGTTMHFTAQFGVPESAPAPPATFKGRRCLVVDGSPSHRSAVAGILSELGAEADESDGPGSAAQKIEEAASPYDLILADARLNTLDDGIALAVRIRDGKLARRVLVMLTTDRPAEAARCRDLGLAYLLKPVRRSALRATIEGEHAGAVERKSLRVERPLRILLADDSADNRFLVRGYLKDSGYILDEAENGALAVEQFMRRTYDLVLMDVEMPVMDGYSATREMRSYERRRGGPETPIVALSAHVLKEDRDKSIDAGCTDHLVKPLGKAALLEAIRRHAGGPPPKAHEETSMESWLQPIVASYLEKCRREVARLRAAVERGDLKAVRTMGHQMAGTGASYGFAAITEIGFKLEGSAAAGDAGRILAGIEELERYLRTAG